MFLLVISNILIGGVFGDPPDGKMMSGLFLFVIFG